MIYNEKMPLTLTPDMRQTWHTWETNGGESFVSATTGWRLSSTGVGQPSQLLKTTDSGATWTEINSLAWSGSLDFISAQVDNCQAGRNHRFPPNLGWWENLDGNRASNRFLVDNPNSR